MTNRERIVEEVEEYPLGICDSCLEEKTGVKPHQQVNNICNSFVQAGKFNREKSSCQSCKKTRQVNRLAQTEKNGLGRSMVEPHTSDGAWFDDKRREMVSALNEIEGKYAQGEGFSRRVSRLRDEKKIPSNIAGHLQYLNSMRNQICYENYRLTNREREIFNLVYIEIKNWHSLRKPS